MCFVALLPHKENEKSIDLGLTLEKLLIISFITGQQIMIKYAACIEYTYDDDISCK